MANQLTDTPTRTLDTLGTFCPFPIIKTQEIVPELELGEVLEVLSDDIGILEDLPAWCRAMKQEFLGCEEEEEGVWRCQVRKVTNR